MQKPILLATLLAVSVASATTRSAPFVEVGGVVVGEAEHFESRLPAQDDDHVWKVVPDEEPGTPSEKANARGGKYMQVYPDTGQNRNSPESQALGPALDYKLDIKTTGEYTLYLRATGHDGASDSLYAQILELRSDAGGPGPNWYKQAPEPDDSDFATRDSDTGWDSRGGADENGGGIGPGPMTFNITRPGIYTLRIQQREDGVCVDAFVLQLSSLPTPAQDIPESSVGPPPANLTVLSVTPGREAQAALLNTPIQIRFRDGTQKVLDQTSVVMKLDGNVVATTKTGPTDGVTSFTHQPATFFAARSRHTVSVDYKDNTGASFTETWSFTVQDYITVPASWAVQPDTSKPGFLVRTVQASFGLPNTNQRAEDHLAGRILDPNTGEVAENIADTSLFTEDFGGLLYYPETGVINYWDNGGQANFPNDTQNVPGIAGGDNYSQEILTFIELPAGVIRMGVNSDDGFRTTVSAGDPRDKFGVMLGHFDGGRGVADTLFSFVVERAGVYPFRTIWEEGGGDSAVEWFVVRPDRTKVLINDTATPGAPKAYRAKLGGYGPYAIVVNPFPGAVNVAPDVTIEVQLKDADTAVDERSVRLTLDGASASPVVTKQAGITSIRLASTALFAPGSAHSLELTYAHGTPAATVTRSWSFTVVNYPTLPCESGTQLGSGDASKPGFRVRTHQVEANQVNSDARGENQLAGRLGDNIADLTGVGPDGFFVVEGQINFNGDGGGDCCGFPGDTWPPGIPGTTGSTDNYAQEILTYVEFPTPGLYRMGVGSDDGFKVTLAEGFDAAALRLGIFDGGRGYDNTIFFFNVAVAGVYPFRLIWYEGQGGSNVEWFMEDRNGSRVLLNDRTQPAGLRAYRARDNTKRLVCQAVEQPEISLKREGNNIVLTFKGTLETSTDLRNWSPVQGATSPRSVSIESGATRFWRAKR